MDFVWGTLDFVVYFVRNLEEVNVLVTVYLIGFLAYDVNALRWSSYYELCFDLYD